MQEKITYPTIQVLHHLKLVNGTLFLSDELNGTTEQRLPGMKEGVEIINAIYPT